MKIMVLSTLYPPDHLGGAEKSVALIARGLAARGHDVAVLALHNSPESTEARDGNITIVRRPLRNIYWPFPKTDRHGTLAKMAFHTVDSLNLFMAWTVREVIGRYKPDIVLSNQLSCFSTMSWKAIHEAGIPVLHSFRDYYLLCPKSTMFRNGSPCTGQCVDCRVLAYPRKWMSHFVDGVTAVSQYMIDRHRSFGLFQNALFLPSILSAVKTPPAISARVAAPPQSVRHFGYIGRIEPEKGIDLLLDGLQAAPEGRWRLSIAGIGPDDYCRHLRHRCEGLPVEFLGYVPDTQFYNKVDVVVVPSIWDEPLPRTVLEAFGYGLTVIASNRGGIPEVVRMGKTGYLIDLDDPSHMHGAIARAIDEPEEGRRFGAAGRDIVAARTEASVAADYEDASQRVIEHAYWRRQPPRAAVGHS